MKPRNGTNISGAEDRRFDRLVDGELGEEDRRTLLSQLDGEPGGWRRCALAFLEAQAWKRDLAGLLSPPAPAAAKPQPAAGSAWWNRNARTVLAMAGSLVIAFMLGVHLSGRDMTTAVTPLGPRTSVVVPAAHGRPANDALGAANPWRMVTLSAQGGGGAIQLPAIQADRLDEAWLRGIPAPVSPDLLQALEESGHRVQQRRELLPVEMNDGRRLVVPVDQVDIDYVGRPRF
jgi:hypothetical protein